MGATYQNPVWPGYFADPFVFRWRDDYYAYGTSGALEADATGTVHAFKILRSRDLVTWSAAGVALGLSGEERAWGFWAPEVAQRDGKFFLYYSRAPAGADEKHRVRVATADQPTGPFVDQGEVMRDAGFSIDAHPFRDPRDGEWYLFFARDYFDERAGTGLAVTRLSSDLLRGIDEPQLVLRANADWQIYQRDRTLYGRRWAAWHTVEGPCVVEHDGRYYCFYSGGNWQTHEYGVSYAVAPHPLGPWVHAPENEPMVLRQKPGEVLGPGHNSYIVAPDGHTELLVYHAWDVARSARRMCIDPLVWTKNGPRCLGPTIEPRSATWITASAA
jgi:beta-xylosidase